ncbi:TVP38/TMEM64 family protein [Cytobacillus purgationiresistens]|uniref:TVP38/TMEM64 family membrane protein n=1 Tax=Cytobacillus purgationiresistens TaxID=863449 RepID=A0ABU0AQV6_9BACI|nr:VTT domain-containing protein [Cytobacillus purgationiresistens]MDQ0273420.1 putative membrane protein YdjX (TVP38/TMEM64 family) [Cytobacillus purgationiresistens]
MGNTEIFYNRKTVLILMEKLVKCMEIQILNWFDTSGIYAIWISILLNIIISIIGILPSFFITAANISFFGFENGLFISIIGEALGAIFSFYLYRKGIDKLRKKNIIKVKNKYLDRLLEARGSEAFLLIVALRIFPYIPSGVVTLVSAGSKVGIINFSIASTIGKIPALFIEAYSIYQILNWNWQGKIILVLVSIFIVSFLVKRYWK